MNIDETSYTDLLTKFYKSHAPGMAIAPSFAHTGEKRWH